VFEPLNDEELRLETRSSDTGPFKAPVNFPSGGWQPQYRFTVIHLMALVFVCALLFSVVLVAGFATLAIALILVAGTIIAVIVAAMAQRGTQQEALLWVLTIAAEKQMPLAPGILAVANQSGGRFLGEIGAVAEWLNAGIPLSDALARVPGLLPSSALTLIRAGWDSGDLAGGLREAAQARATRSPRHPWLGKLAYLFAMLFVIQGIAGFLLYFVLPKFEAIFSDFHVPLPELTKIVIGLAHQFVGGLFVPLIVVFEVAGLAGVLLLYVGLLRIPVPLFDLFFRRKHAMVILRSLAVVVDAGQPLSIGFETLARHYPERGIRWRLVRATTCLKRGDAWYQCLRTHGLIRASDAAVLAVAERAGNLAWALRELADSSERRTGYRVRAWTQILFPVVVLSVGGLVLLFAAAFFTPLVSLIEQLATIE
jgi:type II secretory pathway component PulF